MNQMLYFWLGVSLAFNVAQFIIFLLVCAGIKSNKKNTEEL